MEQKVNRWLNSEFVSKEDKALIKAMNEDEKTDAFYQDVPFGTAGMRGIMGVGDNRINEHTIKKASLGYAKYLLSIENNPKVAIAFDNRNNSQIFALEAAKVMAKHNIEVFIFDKLMPTPLLSYAVRALDCAGGIVITASHNPKEYNGFKVYSPTGRQLLPNEIAKVIEYVNEIDNPLAIDNQLDEQQQGLIQTISDEIVDAYLNEVSEHVKFKNNKNIKIVFSPQHGTAYKLVPELLEKHGYEVIKVVEQCSNNGNFENTKSPNPEDPQAYELALEYADKHNGDIIIVTDPDADRIGIAVRHQHEFRLLNGNETAAIMLDYIIKQSSPTTLKDKVLINTVVTSDIGSVIASSHGIHTHKTLTGFKYIGELIDELKEENYLFGYEESYGTLPIPIVRDKDAVSASLLIAEITQFYHDQDMTLFDALESIYQKHGYFVDRQDSITMPGIEGPSRIKKLISDVNQLEIGVYDQLEIVKIEDYFKQEIITDNEVNKINLPQELMTKVYFKDQGWVAIRPSGTEPKVKLYYSAKGKNSAQAIKNYNQIREFFESIIGA